MTAPPVPLEQVEWRVDSEPYERGGRTACRWVPYLNAPIVARLLDEWVGPDGWSDRYEVGSLGGKEVLWCYLTVGDVTKTDVGMPSNTEAQKGQVSDAFKRAACLKWGVGRNVYDLPTLWAVCGSRESRNGKRIATEIPETLPDILDQLRKRGFAAEGGRVAEAPDPAPEPPERVDPSTGEITAPSLTLVEPGVDYSRMTARQLHEELERRGLPSAGTKAQMVARLNGEPEQVEGAI